jgi:hypothetical protein
MSYPGEVNLPSWHRKCNSSIGKVKCLISGTRRLFLHLGMQKVSFQGPKEFSDMGECEKDLWVAGKISTLQGKFH